jgi:tRNA(Ile)-lysidine synthetase-like protein
MPISKIRNFFSKNGINDCRIALAFSGGTDSTALFHLLQEIKSEFDLSLFALHVNYHLRGKDSGEDQKFVEELCRKYGVELFVKSLHIPNNSSGLEETARNVRYEFFMKIKSEKNIKFIATAHTANDQAETLLFRLIRKTGIKGAAGILKFREDGIIRPILDVTREEILQYLTKNDFLWRQDNSNFDLKFSRNRIRNNVICELEKINSAAVLHLADFCEIMHYLNERERHVCSKHNFLIKKSEKSENIKNICFENELILNETHCRNIEENRQKTGNILLLPAGFKLFVLKNFLLFAKNTDFLEIREQVVDENCKKIAVNNLWEITISDKIPKKGENAAVVSKYDYPLKIGKLSKNDFLKNDKKSTFERMKKFGLSKLERENSPAVFDSSGNLLAAAYCYWKFDKNTEGFRWITIKNVD